MSFNGRRKRMRFYGGIRNYFYRRKNTQKHYSLRGQSQNNSVFLHIVGNLRCIISFRLRCKRMRFYVVFAGTCIL